MRLDFDGLHYKEEDNFVWPLILGIERGKTKNITFQRVITSCLKQLIPKMLLSLIKNLPVCQELKKEFSIMFLKKWSVGKIMGLCQVWGF